MKKFYVTLMVALMSGMFMVPQIDAQSRRSDRASQSASAQRPGRGSRGEGNVRPGSSNSQSRPDKGNQNMNPSRPGRPSSGVATPPKSNRPSNGYGQNYRPGNNKHNRPVSRPSVRPGANRPPVMLPPTRPGRPIYGNSWSRPTPPRNWRPAYRRSLVSDILGLTFGTAINVTLDYLYNNGYRVDGYGSQEVYLRGVRELNYYWDDATLYYSGGGLARSQFFDSSVGYNLSRYNNVFSELCRRYGTPVSVNNYGNTRSATWFGYSGDYIRLEYSMMDSYGGGYRYFTILTYGN